MGMVGLVASQLLAPTALAITPATSATTTPTTTSAAAPGLPRRP